MLYQLENVLEVDNGRKGSTKAVQHTEGTNRKEPSGLISNQWMEEEQIAPGIAAGGCPARRLRVPVR